MQAKFKELFNSGKDSYIPDVVAYANAEFQKGNYKEAIAYYQLDLIVNFMRPGSWNNLGNAYLQSGNMQKAFECYKVVINLDLKFIDAVVNIGNCFNAMFGNMDEAAKWYQWAIKIDPNCQHAYLGLGGIYNRKSQFKKALENLQICLRINPNHYQALNQMAMTLAAEKRYDQAIQLSKRFLNSIQTTKWQRYLFRRSRKREDDILSKIQLKQKIQLFKNRDNKDEKITIILFC